MKLANSPAMLTVFGKIEANLVTGGPTCSQYRLAAKAFNYDTNLTWLTSAIGKIGDTINRKDALLHVASITCAWLEAMEVYCVLTVVSDERLRQRRLFAAGKITFDVSSKEPKSDRKLRVLVEELGEVAEAIDRIEQHSHSAEWAETWQKQLITELVQVAAVCVAWLESLETKPTTKGTK